MVLPTKFIYKKSKEKIKRLYRVMFSENLFSMTGEKWKQIDFSKKIIGKICLQACYW
jgi:hypothetical protein